MSPSDSFCFATEVGTSSLRFFLVFLAQGRGTFFRFRVHDLATFLGFRGIYADNATGYGVCCGTVEDFGKWARRSCASRPIASFRPNAASIRSPTVRRAPVFPFRHACQPSFALSAGIWSRMRGILAGTSLRSTAKNRDASSYQLGWGWDSELGRVHTNLSASTISAK